MCACMRTPVLMHGVSSAFAELTPLHPSVENMLPVVQVGGVRPHLGSEPLQQAPRRAERQRLGLAGGEDEAEGAVGGGGDAHVTVRSVGHVLHQPLHLHHGEVVDVQGSSWMPKVKKKNNIKTPSLLGKNSNSIGCFKLGEYFWTGHHHA